MLVHWLFWIFQRVWVVWGQRGKVYFWLFRLHRGCNKGHSGGWEGGHIACGKNKQSSSRAEATFQSCQSCGTEATGQSFGQSRCRHHPPCTGQSVACSHPDFGPAAGTFDGVLQGCGVGIVHAWPCGLLIGQSLVGLR